MPNYQRDTVEFDAELVSSTHAAYLFMIEDQEVWVPKSQCEWTPTSDDGVVGTVEMSTQLAVEKDLA